MSLLSNPFAEERAYSSSATLVLSILTAFVLAIPNVSAACPPMSLSTSLALRPSIAVPSTRRKSLSTTPLVNVATLPLLIPALGMSLVSATVPAELGKVIVTSAVLEVQ